jgi:adenosylcobalamin phosphodiesterase
VGVRVWFRCAPVRPRYLIGTTSFVHRASWLENAEQLAGRVRDVELLLLDLDHAVPSPGEVAALGGLARRTGLGFTVHTPLGVALASADEARRRRSAERVARAIALAAPLAPRAFVIHLFPGEREGEPPPDAGWRARAERSIAEILATGVEPGAVCLESLDDGYAAVEPLLDAFGLSAALDVGHLARDGRPFDALLARNLRRARVVQWHGTDATGRDHRSIRHFPRPDGVRLLRTLAAAGWEGVLTLEVFSEADLDDSLAVLADLEAEASGAHVLDTGASAPRPDPGSPPPDPASSRPEPASP